MNGRQKAMTSMLGGYRRDGMVDATSAAARVEPLRLLKLIVEMADRGEVVIRDMSFETFQEPQYRDYATLDGRMERALIQANQFAGVKFDVVPSGRVRDGDEDRTISVRNSNPDDDMGELFGAEPDDEESAPLESPTDGPSFEPVKRGKRGSKSAPKPATPAGASAAREIIFDDDGSDPT